MAATSHGSNVRMAYNNLIDIGYVSLSKASPEVQREVMDLKRELMEIDHDKRIALQKGDVDYLSELRSGENNVRSRLIRIKQTLEGQSTMFQF
jgi:hypothetical protein